MVGVAPPAWPAAPAEVRELGRRRWGSGAPVRGLRGGPSSRTQPPSRGRQRSYITSLAKTPEKREKPGRRNTVARRGRGGVCLLLWATPPPGDAPFVELHERHSTDVFAMSNGAPPAASGTNVIYGQVGGCVGAALVARGPVAALATPGAEHAGAESLPGPRAVEGVVPAAVGLAWGPPRGVSSCVSASTSASGSARQGSARAASSPPPTLDRRHPAPAAIRNDRATHSGLRRTRRDTRSNPGDHTPRGWRGRRGHVRTQRASPLPTRSRMDPAHRTP